MRNGFGHPEGLALAGGHLCQKFSSQTFLFGFQKHTLNTQRSGRFFFKFWMFLAFGEGRKLFNPYLRGRYGLFFLQKGDIKRVPSQKPHFLFNFLPLKLKKSAGSQRVCDTWCNGTFGGNFRGFSFRIAQIIDWSCFLLFQSNFFRFRLTKGDLRSFWFLGDIAQKGERAKKWGDFFDFFFTFVGESEIDF